MNPTTPVDLMAYITRHAPTPYATPVRVLTRGKRDVEWVWMLGGVTVPGTMETTEEVDVLMRERKAVEV